MTGIALILISLFYTGLECCENQTVLCKYRYWNPDRIICENALCDCRGHAMDLTSTRIVECNGVLNQIPLNQIPITTETVHITGNNLTAIKSGTFSGLSYLTIVSISNNNIEIIETTAFENLPRLSKLSLSSNNIKIIETRPFSNLPYLGNIDLTGNSLTTIKSGTFNDLPGLQVLYLTGSRIKILEQYSFTNLPNMGMMDMNSNEISSIESKAFSNISIDTIRMENNNLTVIQSGAFRDFQKLNTLLLQENRIEVIESRAFSNITGLNALIMSRNPVVIIESFAFSTLHSHDLQIIINNGKLRWVKEDAFFNVTAGTLVLGVDQDIIFEENFIASSIKIIYIVPPYLNCNCSLMWVALWLQEEKNIGGFADDVLCRNDTKTEVNKLTVDYFSHCKGMSERFVCNQSGAVSILCTFSYVRSDFVEWIHTRNGRYIRTLKTLSNVLSIPFCSIEDTGEYTCVRSTRYSSIPYINITTTLQVLGKPVILGRGTQELGTDLMLSVTLYSITGANINWFFGERKLYNGSNYKINTSTTPVTLVQYNKEIQVEGFITTLEIYNYNSLLSNAYTCRITNDIGSVDEVLLSQPIDIVLQRNTICDSSSRLEIGCSLNNVGAAPKYFIHKSGGKTIRTLTGTRVNNTYTLTIPFCNYQDIGDYTCYWHTDIQGLETVKKTTTLTINGPPIILHSSTLELEAFIILSVMFYSQPYPIEPKWYLDNEAVVLGSHIQQSTTLSKVEIQLHRVTTFVDGFISNLTIKTGKEKYSFYKCHVENTFGSSNAIITLQRDQTRVIEQTDTGTNFDALPIIIGSIGAVFIILMIIVVVHIKRRSFCERKGSDTYNESTESRDAESYYDSIKMSSIATTPDDYIEVY